MDLGSCPDCWRLVAFFPQVSASVFPPPKSVGTGSSTPRNYVCKALSSGVCCAFHARFLFFFSFASICIFCLYKLFYSFFSVSVAYDFGYILVFLVFFFFFFGRRFSSETVSREVVAHSFLGCPFGRTGVRSTRLGFCVAPSLKPPPPPVAPESP